MEKRKITFIGAGSFSFVKNIVGDITRFPAFDEAELCLMDINEEKMSYSYQAVLRILKETGSHMTVRCTTDRAEALKGADGVLITILATSPKVFRSDIEIPMKYGIDLNVGDTRGPSGIFRFLRTAPVMLEICRDIEKYCPDAIVLNYTNPMALLCRYLLEMTTLQITGLCHSVQLTSEMLAGWIGAKKEEITYTCAGINHQAFYLDFKWNGRDAYPLLREAVKKPEIYNEDQVRNEMFRHLDYFVTESSGHNSEYNQWFRKRKDLLEKYCTGGTGWNPGIHAFSLNIYLSKQDTWQQDARDWLAAEKMDVIGGVEYAADILNACFGDLAVFRFNGNTRNFGNVPNLPYGCCVEIPMYASRGKLVSSQVGNLPRQLATLIATSANCEEMAVEACRTGDRHKAFQAILFDPLTSAVLSMQEIQDMTDEMFEANKDYLGYMK